jgi:hypothetical protein
MRQKWIMLALVFILNISVILGNEIYLSSAAAVNVSGSDQLNTANLDHSIHLPAIRKDYNWAALNEWTPWAFQDNYVTDVYTGPEPGEIWVIADNVLYHSNTFGFDWKKIDTGEYLPNSFTIDQQCENDCTKFIATTSGEVLASLDLINWTVEFSYYNPLNFFTPPITFFGWVDNDLFLVLNEYTRSLIFRRTSDGVWETFGNPVQVIVLDLSIFQSTLYAGTNDGLYRLEDGVWTEVFVYATEESLSITDMLVDNGNLIVGTSSPRGIYSTSDGIKWTALDVGLTNAYVVNIRQIESSDSGTLFTTAEDGIFMSANDGARWQILDAGLPRTITNYGVILEDIQGTSISILRDFPNEQTLAATFNNQGLWLLTVNKDTWLTSPPPRDPPKAVLIVGPVDPPLHQSTKDFISWSNKLADIMQRNGMQVVKVYWPDSTWENVRAAIGGASIIVYKGHGFSAGEPGEDPTELYGGTNGFCLVNPNDPEGAVLGTQDMLVTTNRLAENAIGFFFCCYCAGPSASDTSTVSEDWARWRIEAYSSTVLRMGGRGYFSGVDEEAILNAFFSNIDKPLGEIYKSVQGAPDHTSLHILSSNIVVWFDGSITENWGEAYVGDPNLTPRQILGR